MFANELRRSVEAATRSRLPDVAAVMWRAYGAGQISETEAEALSALIEARKGPASHAGCPQEARGLAAPLRLTAWSADAAGRPLVGFRRASRLGSRWPRPPAAAIAGCTSTTLQPWQACPAPP